MIKKEGDADMKMACLLLALIAMTLSGCEQKGDVEPNQADVNFDKDLEQFYQKAVGSPYQISNYSATMVSMVDIANVRLSYANYKSSQRLRTTTTRTTIKIPLQATLQAIH